MVETEIFAKWLPLTFYMGNHSFTGSLRQPTNVRLTDFLNHKADTQSNKADTFIEVINSNTLYEDGTRQKQHATYVNKTSVILVVAEDGDLARGVGARDGSKTYPFVQKHPSRITAQMPTCTLIADMHCATGQQPLDVLSSKSMFLPLTNVKLKTQGESVWRTAPFAAINRSHILSLHKEETNPDSLSPA